MDTISKGELRRLRKARVAAGQSWTVEASNDGAGPGFTQVRERTNRQERAHEARMERWARRCERSGHWD